MDFSKAWETAVLRGELADPHSKSAHHFQSTSSPKTDKPKKESHLPSLLYCAPLIHLSLRKTVFYVMAIHTKADIPEPLHDRLRRRAENAGTSIRRLIVRALEQVYQDPGRGEPVTGPLVHLAGKRGPRFPVDENPHELFLP